MDLSIPYYEDNTRISNSAIGWYLKKGPAYLRKKLDGEIPDEKSTALDRGTMIHEYILQPEEFKNDYVVCNIEKPTSKQQELFCKAYIESTEIEPEKAAVSAYKEAYSTVGKSNDKILSEALKTASTLKEYIELIKNDNRKIISYYHYNVLNKIKENISEHILAKKLLDIPEEGCEAFNEFHINWNASQWHTETLIKCKSLLDRVIFDYKNRVCTIIDLKTTRNIWTFEESMEKYDYLRQLCFYMMAVKWYIKEELKDEETWKFKFYIVGINTENNMYEIRVFTIPVEKVKNRTHIIDWALVNIGYHIQHDKWDHSMDYYLYSGEDKLNYEQIS